MRTIGALELLGAVGLNAPYLVKAVPKLVVPLAAGGLALTMIGAIVTHVGRADPIASTIITSVLFVMSATVALERFGQFKNEL